MAEDIVEPIYDDPVEEGHVTDTADLMSDQSETVADQGPPAAPEHEVDQSETAADHAEDPPAEPYLVDPPPAPAEAFPQQSAPESTASAKAPHKQPKEGSHMVKWLGVKGQPDDRAELRLDDKPDSKVYHPGDNVPLSKEQQESMRRTGDHLFEGDDDTKPAP